MTEDGNWQENLKAQNTQLQADLQLAPKEDAKRIKEMIATNEKFLKDNINPNSKTNWHFINDVVLGAAPLVTLFAVITASGIVAAEFSDGTIKQLLIRPHRRSKILLSKYIAVILFALILFITLTLGGFGVSVVYYGFGDFHTPFLEYTLDGVKQAEVGGQALLKLALYLPGLVMITTISFALSTLFKSQAIAVGVGIFVLFLSSALGGLIILLAQEYEWIKYVIFPHLDLTIFALQDKIFGTIPLSGSLGILGIYYLIFMAAAFYFFERRDVTI